MTLPVSLTVIALIIVCIKGLIDGLLRPVVEHYSWSPHVLRFGAWLLGAVLVVLSQLLPERTFLVMVTALVVGCGSNILQEFLSALGSGQQGDPQ